MKHTKEHAVYGIEFSCSAEYKSQMEENKELIGANLKSC